MVWPICICCQKKSAIRCDVTGQSRQDTSSAGSRALAPVCIVPPRNEMSRCHAVYSAVAPASSLRSGSRRATWVSRACGNARSLAHRARDLSRVGQCAISRALRQMRRCPASTVGRHFISRASHGRSILNSGEIAKNRRVAAGKASMLPPRTIVRRSGSWCSMPNAIHVGGVPTSETAGGRAVFS